MEIWKHGKTRLVMGPPENGKYRLHLYSMATNGLIATYKVPSRAHAFDLIRRHIFGPWPKETKT